MYIIPEDFEILRTKEIRALQEQYKEKFGSYFLYFNYADFPGSKTQLAAEMYRDALRKAVADDKPHQIVSHRYDHSDH